MKKIALFCLMFVLFAACSGNSEPTLEPSIRDGVYGALLYITTDPADSIYSRTNNTLLVLQEENGSWAICLTFGCFDTTFTDGVLHGISTNTGVGPDNCEYTTNETFTLSSYPDGTNNVIDGWYVFDLTDCTMEDGKVWHLEAYVFGINIDTFIP